MLIWLPWAALTLLVLVAVILGGAADHHNRRQAQLEARHRATEQCPVPFSPRG